MRIGLFTDTYLPDINGVVSSIVTLQKELEKHGHDVFVITTHSSLLKTSYEENIYRLPGIELKALYGYIATSPIHLKAIKDIEKMNLEVIHVHTEFGIGIFARIVSKKLQIPLISTYHTTYEDYTHYVNFFHLDTFDTIAKKAVSFLSKMYGNSCIRVIAPSRKTKEMLEGYHVRRDIDVIPTGLNLLKFSPGSTETSEIAAIKAECGLVEGTYSMVFVGRIAKEKAIDVAIEGFKYVKEMNLPCKLIIVGSGPDEKSLKELVSTYDLNDYVYFAGRKESATIQKYYHAFDMFVSASLTETQGMTFIEALSAGLPVFARPDEVLKDLVIDQVNGYYFNEPKELAKAIKNYIELEDDKKANMRLKGLEAAYPYDSEVFYNKIIHVYENALSQYYDSYLVDSISRRNETVYLVLRHVTKPEIKLSILTDSFLEFGLRKNARIHNEELAELIIIEKYAKAYQACLKKISFKDRTVKEIYDYLTQETTLDIKQINAIVEKLEQKGLLNDLNYALYYVEKAITAFQGRANIERSLKKKGICIEFIDQALNQQDDQDEVRYALKYANKVKHTVKDKSLKEKKTIIKRKMFAHGYRMELINDALEQLTFVDDELNELNALRKNADKAYRRFEKRLNGTTLRNAVFKACVTKGFNYEDIYLVLNEMEWDDE